MDHWHTQFNQLKNQWSNYTWLDYNNRTHFEKKEIARIGVAWVVKIPGENFRAPVGWEVEIIDTPIGISERSHNLLNWLKNPPPNFFDRIVSYYESPNLQSNGIPFDYDTKPSINNPIKYVSFHSPDLQESDTIPPNEYEIFKKGCCHCSKKYFKNSINNTDENLSKNDKTLIEASKEVMTATAYTLDSKKPEEIISDVQLSPRLSHKSGHHDINSEDYSEKEIKNHIIDTDSAEVSQESQPINHGFNDTKEINDITHSEERSRSRRSRTLSSLRRMKMNETNPNYENNNNNNNNNPVNLNKGTESDLVRDKERNHRRRHRRGSRDVDTMTDINYVASDYSPNNTD